MIGWSDADAAWVRAQLDDLLRMPSGSGRERRTWLHCCRVLRELGYAVQEWSVRGGEVGHLWAELDGERGDPVLLTAHLDTAVHAGARPVETDDGRIVNACVGPVGADGKAGVAAVLGAARLAASVSPSARAPIRILLTVQEERGLRGIQTVSPRRIRARYGLCLDGDAPWYVVYDHGPGAIVWSAYTRRVPTSAEASRRILQPYRRGREARIQVTVRHESLDGSGVHVSGYAVGSSHPVVLAHTVRSRLKRWFNGATQVQLVWQTVYPPLCLHATVPARERLLSAAHVFRRPLLFCEASGGADAHWLAQWGIPTVICGTGVRDVHRPTESVRVHDVLAAALLAGHFCMIPS